MRSTLNSKRLEIANLLIHKGKWISTYPACSYEIPRTLKALKEYEKRITKEEEFLKVAIFLIRKIMGDIWSSIASASSEEIPLEKQLELIRMFGNCWERTGQSILTSDKPSFLDSITKFITSYTDHIRKARISLKYLKEEKFFIERSEPIFLLRSGYRSFYFFNFDKMTHDPEMLPILRESLLKEVKNLMERARHKGKKITKIVVFEKPFGEAAGTEPLAAWVSQETGLKIATLPPLLAYAYKDRIKGSAISSENVLLVIDGVLTTGESAKVRIRRIKEMTRSEVYGGVFYAHRELGALPQELKPPKLESRIVNTKTEFIRTKRWKPEILGISFDSPLWPSIDMSCDYLKEICSYTSNEGRYNKMREKFSNLLVDTYKTFTLSNELIRYLTNVHMLCWNYIKRSLLKEEIPEDEGEIIEYVEDFLSLEIIKRLTVSPCAKILSKEIQKLSAVDVDFLQRLFVKKQNDILKNIKNNLEKTIYMEMSVPKERAMALVNEVVSHTRKTAEKYTKNYHLDLEKLDESEEILRQEYWKLLRRYFKIS